MATIKVACPKCGQKVSGDETFYGTTVECPICSADIHFPGIRRETPPADWVPPVVPPEGSSGNFRSWSSPSGPPHGVGGGPGSPLEPVAAERPGPSWSVDEEEFRPRRETSVPLPPETGETALPPTPLWGAMSIVSAVLAVITCVGGILFAPMAIIFGHTALAKARQSPVQPAPGHTLGALGLMIGYVSLVLTILVLIAAVIFDDTLRGWLGRE